MNVKKIDGIAADLEVFDDHATITPKGLLGLIDKALKGTTTIQYVALTGLQLKKAGLQSGYLHFVTPGAVEVRGLWAATSDENCFIFDATQNAAVEEARAFIEQRRAEMIGTVAEQTADSLADQLTKLAELKEKGLLTDAEFTRAKEKLIG